MCLDCKCRISPSEVRVFTQDNSIRRTGIRYVVSSAPSALAWLLEQDAVDAPIVGTTSVEHLEDAVEALDIDLSESDRRYLEEPYEPVPVSGHE